MLQQQRRRQQLKSGIETLCNNTAITFTEFIANPTQSTTCHNSYASPTQRPHLFLFNKSQTEAINAGKGRLPDVLMGTVRSVWVYSQHFELHVGQRLGVYRHDAVIAEVPAECTEIWVRHTHDVI